MHFNADPPVLILPCCPLRNPDAYAVCSDLSFAPTCGAINAWSPIPRILALEAEVKHGVCQLGLIAQVLKLQLEEDFEEQVPQQVRRGKGILPLLRKLRAQVNAAAKNLDSIALICAVDVVVRHATILHLY